MTVKVFSFEDTILEVETATVSNITLVIGSTNYACSSKYFVVPRIRSSPVNGT